MLLFLGACAPEASSELPPLPSSNTTSTSSDESSSQSGPTYYHAKITRENSGLTGDDSTEAIVTNITTDEDAGVSYSFEIGAPAYQHHKFDEFVLKGSAYVKSSSSYRVERLLVDVYKGSDFAVYAGSEKGTTPLEKHQSSVAPQDSADGVVYEYAIENDGFYVANGDSSRKASFYSITVIFSI